MKHRNTSPTDDRAEVIRLYDELFLLYPAARKKLTRSIEYQLTHHDSLVLKGVSEKALSYWQPSAILALEKKVEGMTPVAGPIDSADMVPEVVLKRLVRRLIS